MSSTGNAIKATMLTFVIAAACFLPPVLHFITGPLGPAIGGYFAGHKFRVTPGQAVIVGVIVGITVGILGPYLIHALTLPGYHPTTLITIFFFAFAILYTGILSGVAAWAGGVAAREATTS